MTVSQQGCCDLNCFGNVTIITIDLQVITGTIVCHRTEDDGVVLNSTKLEAQTAAEHCDHDEDGPDFVTVELTAPLLKIPGGGGPAIVQPFFVVGDVIRINLNQIVTVGPVNIDS